VSALQGINLVNEIKFEDIDLTLLKGISLQPGDESHVIFRANGGVEGQAYYVELNEAIKNAGVSSSKPFAQLHQAPGLERGQLGVFVYLENKDSGLETVHISSDDPIAKLRTCLPAEDEG
jgi:hypothetical protein